MERDYGKEIDSLKARIKNFQSATDSQLDELRAMVTQLLPDKSSAENRATVYAVKEMHSDSRLSELLEDLCCQTEEKDLSGLLTYFGVYQSGGRQSNWIRNAVSADALLALIESGIAGKVLACVGNANRLAILLEILRGPKTVAMLVEKCGFGSTGQVYHHMKPLLAADVVAEDERQKGVYVIRPHKVQGLLMLLAGISDMADETYTRGVWEPAGVKKTQP